MVPVKKKGGIFIKKINIFLILFFLLLVLPVKAEAIQFYEAEYIDNIYMNKYQYSTHTIYYQKARFFRKVGTDEAAYCIEPFRFFNEESSYQSTIQPDSLTKEQIDAMTKIAYYGYGYSNHTDPKWYAITQLLIWQIASSDGEYYFTDSLNGNRIDIFQDEIQEIYALIEKDSILPSFAQKSFDLVENHSLSLVDENHVLPSFTSNQNIITEDSLKIGPLKAGDYEYSLQKILFYQKPFLFYQSVDSQNLLETGDIPPIETKIKVHVIPTYLEISKIDQNTKSTVPSGEASLDGAIYSLYDSKNHFIQDLVIKENQAFLPNLDFGDYKIQEKEAGEGYLLDQKSYSFTISKENPRVSIVLKNQVIQKKVIIEKQYGEEGNLRKEANVSFYIKNKRGDIIQTVSTNQNGKVAIFLPYGTYQIIQVNTTDGYEKAKPFTITVHDQEEKTISLIDWIIPVPDTYIDTEETDSWIFYFFYFLFFVLC